MVGVLRIEANDLQMPKSHQHHQEAESEASMKSVAQTISRCRTNVGPMCQTRV